jgi:hypothetical protein
VYGVGEEPDPRFTLANERTLLAWMRNWRLIERALRLRQPLPARPRSWSSVRP